MKPDVNEGRGPGSMTPEKEDCCKTHLSLHHLNKSDWFDGFLLILSLGLPYMVQGSSIKAGLAFACLISWICVIKPSWRGLMGFFGTGLLLLQALILTMMVIF